MELYFLRHAIAVDRGTPEYEDDSQRPLTPAGRKQMERVARGMKSLGLKFDWIFSSPYVRAKATAKVVSGTFRLEDKLKFSRHLAAEGDPELFVEQVARMHDPPKRLLVVGHEPYLSRLVATLVGGHDGASLKLKKGGLCKLATNKLKFGCCAQLKWLLTPRQLALLAGVSLPKQRRAARINRGKAKP